MTPVIHVYTFGRLAIERDGMVLENFISTKAVLLFVYLAMHPGDHSRKKLAALLWSETTDEQALKNLRTVLSSLRQQLDDVLSVSRDDLAINSSVFVNVDAVRFEDGFKTIFSSRGTLDQLKAMQELEALYRGEFLNNVVIRDAEEFDTWVGENQRQYQELYRHLLLEMTVLLEKQAHYEDALRYAWKLVNLDPLSDPVQRQVMRLLAYTNRTNDALLHYERFVTLLKRELEVEPEDETTALYEQIRAREFTVPKAPSTFSLALPDAPFVEPVEDHELAQRMLNTPHCHLLTIYGISGIGKTVLATQLAFHRQHRYRDGACFVSLTVAQTAHDLVRLVAGALNLNVSSSTDYQTLEATIVDYLRNRELLLVLDNYEQVLPETSFVQRVLQDATSVQVIVTSHMQLSLYREWLLPLRGLKTPEIDAANAQDYEAVRLFEITAQRINPRFRLGDSLKDVIRICQLVDSLPLGIVIAAGWVQYISPAEILAMIQKDLLQVEAVNRDLPQRHHSFQSLLNAMLEHLTAAEQNALLCLSIFEGSFDVKAALAVANISMSAFKALADKCLVQQTEGYRYTVHRVVRQAFRAHLENSPLLREVAGRYVAYYQAWCDAIYAQGLPLHELGDAIDLEQHNLWNVSGLSDSERQRFLLHIAPALHEYWVNRGYHARGVLELLQAGGNNPDIPAETRVRGLMTLARILERTSHYPQAWSVCEQVLALEAELNIPEIRARALRVLSEICARQGDYTQASDYLQTIIAMGSQTSLATSPPIERLISLAYEDLGEMWMQQGDYDAACHYIEIAIHRWIERKEPLREAIARSYLGVIAMKRNDDVYAFQLFKSILTIAKQAQNQTLIVVFSSHLGVAAMHLRDYALTCEMFHDALRLALLIDRKVSIVYLLEQYSRLAAESAHYDISTQLAAFCDALRERLHLPVTPHNQADHASHQQRLLDYLGAAFEPNYQIGYSIGLNTAVQLAAALTTTITHQPNKPIPMSTERIVQNEGALPPMNLTR